MHLVDAEGLRRQLLPEQEQQLQIIQLRSGSCTNAQITAACPDAEVLIAEPNNRLDAQLIASLPKLKLINGVGVGYNLFDLEAARQAGMKDGALPAATLWPAPPLPKPCAAVRLPEPDWTPLRRNRSQRKIRCSACRMIAAAIRAVQSGQRPENIVNGL